MKIKDVCIQTGLTDRAVRFYVEKGLISTEENSSNGRINRDYNEENVAELKDIAKLRKAGFTIQDIMEMQNSESSMSNIILKQLESLEERHTSDEQLINELKDIHKRGDMSWRKVASLLFRTKHEHIYTLNFAQFDEPLIEEKKHMRINYKVIIFVLFACVLLAMGIYVTRSERHLTTVIAIGDVTFHDTWYDDGNAFAKMSTSLETLNEYHGYFGEAKAIGLKSSDYCEAIKLDGLPYQSVTIVIDIPYIQAKNLELLDVEQNIIIVEKVLESEEYIQKYCTIVAIMR